MAQKIDTIIVGAGISGMSAAHKLLNAGKTVVVLEARERVGGRTWSQKFGRGFVDLGGEWIGPSQKRVNRLVQDLQITLFPNYTTGKKTLDMYGKVSHFTGLIPKMAPHHLIIAQISIWRLDAMARKIDKVEPWKSKNAEKYDSMTLASWQRKNMPTRKSRDLMNSALAVIFGSDAKDLSFLHFLLYVHSGGGLAKMLDAEAGSQHDRISGGPDEICRRIAKRLGKNLCLKTPVRKIMQTSHNVTVVSGSRTWIAKTLILAIPPALINSIDFQPALPAGKRQLYMRIPMASLAKIYVNYNKPFWRESGYSGEIVSCGGPICVGFDNVDQDGKQPCLLVFVGGDQIRFFSKISQKEREKKIIHELVRIFGPEAGYHTGYLECNWMNEPYSLGGPIGFFPPNTLYTLGKHLRTPYMNTFFASTETARDHLGFIEGAIEAGERAASEALAHQ